MARRNPPHRRNARWNARHKNGPPPIWWRAIPEPMVGLEPTACRLRGGCSTTELHRRGQTPPCAAPREEYQSVESGGQRHDLTVTLTEVRLMRGLPASD